MSLDRKLETAWSAVHVCCLAGEAAIMAATRDSRVIVKAASARHAAQNFIDRLKGRLIDRENEAQLIQLAVDRASKVLFNASRLPDVQPDAAAALREASNAIAKLKWHAPLPQEISSTAHVVTDCRTETLSDGERDTLLALTAEAWGHARQDPGKKRQIPQYDRLLRLLTGGDTVVRVERTLRPD
jgi:hypothetical protein